MRVLVTRPLADGARTAARLAALGHEAVLAPVLTLAATGRPRPAGPFDALLVTSANAIPHLTPADAALPVYAVGERTAAAARLAGLVVAGVAEGDAKALARLVRARCAAGSRLLHATGETRKAEPEHSLAEVGFDPVAWEVYAALPADRLPDEASSALATGAIGAVMHYSRRSAEVLLDLAERAGLAGRIAAVPHLCLSEDVAVPLRRAGAERVVVASSPDESALLAGLAAFASPLPSEGC